MWWRRRDTLILWFPKGVDYIFIHPRWSLTYYRRSRFASVQSLNNLNQLPFSLEQFRRVSSISRSYILIMLKNQASLQLFHTQEWIYLFKNMQNVTDRTRLPMPGLMMVWFRFLLRTDLPAVSNISNILQKLEISITHTNLRTRRLVPMSPGKSYSTFSINNPCKVGFLYFGQEAISPIITVSTGSQIPRYCRKILLSLRFHRCKPGLVEEVAPQVDLD